MILRRQFRLASPLEPHEVTERFRNAIQKKCRLLVRRQKEKKFSGELLPHEIRFSPTSGMVSPAYVAKLAKRSGGGTDVAISVGLTRASKSALVGTGLGLVLGIVTTAGWLFESATNIGIMAGGIGIGLAFEYALFAVQAKRTQRQLIALLEVNEHAEG